MNINKKTSDNCFNYSIEYIKSKFAAKDPKFASIYERYNKVYPLEIEKLCEEIGLIIECRDDLHVGNTGYSDGKKTIITNMKHSERRQRVTIATELGHYILHEWKNNREQSYVYTGIQRIYKREANLFARSILTPEEEINRITNAYIRGKITGNLLVYLARSFDVGADFLKVRLVTLGFIKGW